MAASCGRVVQLYPKEGTLNFALRAAKPGRLNGAMKFSAPLVSGRLVLRYKRFLADVVLDNGATVTASCPNTGSMLGLVAPGSRVWLSESDSSSRKYRHTWEMVEADLGEGPAI